MKIYTRQGDGGQTSLWVDKGGQGQLRVEAYGTVDEVSSWLGLARRDMEFWKIRNFSGTYSKSCCFWQRNWPVPGEASRLKDSLTEGDIGELEKAIDAIGSKSVPKGICFAGGTLTAGYLDVARTVCAGERVTVALARQEEVRREITVYLNRLSDPLYLMARQEVFQEVVEQVTEKVKGYMDNNKQEERSSTWPRRGELSRLPKKRPRSWVSQWYQPWSTAAAT